MLGRSLWRRTDAEQGKYDLAAFGPNGFLRTFRGSVFPTAKTNLSVESRYDGREEFITLIVTNLGTETSRVTIPNAYGDDEPVTRVLRPGQSLRERWELKESFGWYDLSRDRYRPRVPARLAGHLENGRDSASDPAFGVNRDRSRRGERSEQG